LLTSFDDLIEVVKRRKSFLDLYNGIENNPEEHTPLEEDPEDSETLTTEQKAAHAEKYGDTDNSVRIETATGFKSYNIGEEVYIGAKLKKGKEGHTTKHFVRGTILGRSSKGNIIIKTDKGK